MSACPAPTDSILRRHHDQLAAIAGLSTPPQDSVQRRHYQQLLAARLAVRSAGGPAPASVRPEPVRRQPSAAESPTAQAPQGPSAPPPARTSANVEPKGWFASVLERILGR